MLSKQWVTAIRLFMWKTLNNISTNAVSKLNPILNENLDIQIPSNYIIKKKIKSLTERFSAEYDMCPKGCIAFTDVKNYKNLDCCPFCKESRWKKDGKSPRRVYKVASIKNWMRLRLQSPDFRNNVLHQYNTINSEKWISNDGTISDVYDGSIFRDLHSRGFFHSQFDTNWFLTTDGVSM